MRRKARGAHEATPAQPKSLFSRTALMRRKARGAHEAALTAADRPPAK
jgi:hypothetical protein